MSVFSPANKMDEEKVRWDKYYIIVRVCANASTLSTLESYDIFYF